MLQKLKNVFHDAIIFDSSKYLIVFNKDSVNFFLKEIESLQEMITQYQKMLVHYNQLKGIYVLYIAVSQQIAS